MADLNALARFRQQRLTLDGLVEAAGRLLRRLDVHPDDGRVTAEPDERGVRYYQAMGLVDKPLDYDGRRAIYGYRHLLQLLTVKRLQQEGHPLQLIQRALAGRHTDALERALTTMLAEPEKEPGGPPSEPMVLASASTPSLESARAAERLATEPVAARLAPGVTVVIDPEIVGDPAPLVHALAEFLRTRRKEH